jgi:hypothetical protein
MDDETKLLWLHVGERLLGASPEKFADAMRGLREVAEAQELIARYDAQLFFRGRPRKTYSA